ncbi:MAG: S-layer homology domain-containing protein [Clostridia bacterium]|nr:S-layer homology domain-containing protein [Clostridia bacterium]
MKKTAKLLSVILAVIMMTTMIPVTMLNSMAAPTSSTVVYIMADGSGNGTAPDKPTTLVKAITTLDAAGGGTIVLVGPTNLTSNILLGNNSPDITIKVTSVYGGVDYRETANAALVFTKDWINVSSKNVFEYENINFLMQGANCSFFGNGFPLTFGKGVKVIIAEGRDAKDVKNYPNIYGGSAHDLSGTTNFPAHTSITVLSGTFRSVYPSGFGTEAKPRPSLSATLAISSKVKIMHALGYEYNAPHSKIEGDVTLITIDGRHEALKHDTEKKVVEVSGGNGHVSGIAPGKVMICADTGYAAKIGDKVVPNGAYEFDGAELKVTFVESDINREAELALTRPTLPAAIPGEYIKGYDNGDGTFSFKPSGNITIAEASTILVRLMTTEDAIKGQYTTDKAKESDWFYNNIAYLDAYGSFDTFDNFDGNRQITRAEFVKLVSLYRKILAKTTEEIKFTDVSADYKYADCIKTATMGKIVNGYDNGDGTFSFKPDAPITRAEVVTVINRIFDMADLAPIKYKDKLPNFSDVDITHWAAYQIIAAAGGKDKPAEKQEITGTGEVEHTVAGNVVFVKDGGEGDGSSAEKATTWNKGVGLIKESGTVVVCGPVEFNSNFRFSGGHTGTQIITSVYDGVDYRATADAAIIFGSNWRNGVPAGTTIFDNIAFISKGSNCSIYCDNQNVTFGKDVVCVIESGAPIALYGGSANDLSACVNYIDSTSTAVAHTGNYFANLTINGGTWGNISGTGNGSEAKPRENNGSAITISGEVIAGSITCGNSTTMGKRVNGLRTLVLNNYGAATIDPVHYDIIVSVKAEAEAKVVGMTKESVTILVTANDGSKVQGVNDDGTITFEGEGSLIVTGTGNAITAVKGGKTAIDGVVDENVEFVTDEYLKELDARQAQRKAEILATVSTIKPKEGKKAYYVSSSAGNDENDGLSADKPFKTITKVNAANLVPGDVVYFKRGDEWRGTTLKAKNGVSYTAYGEGAKPVISLSPFDGAKHGTWTPVEGYTNVYKYSELFTEDIGSLAFNERTFTEIYAQKILFDFIGKDPAKPHFRGDPADKIAEDQLSYLKNDLDFWHDTKGPNITYAKGGELYLRSDKGNPAERFTNIEFNPRASCITVGNAVDVTIDNLTIRHAGVHGVSSSTTRNLTVTNCVFEWIGGGVQNYNDGSYVRLGNAVEIYGGCEGYIVDNCYIEQVYDAGVTHQVSHESDGDYVMKDVTYSNNVILNCIYSIEHFNRARANTTRYLVNINYKNNLCRYAGYCFGNTRPDKTVASHIRSGTIVDTANFVVENNVFDRSTVQLFKLQAGGDEQIQWKNNVYIHRLGASYGTMTGVSITYNGNISKEVERYFAFPEVNGKYLFIKE